MSFRGNDHCIADKGNEMFGLQCDLSRLLAEWAVFIIRGNIRTHGT